MITLIDINKETKSKIYMIDISDILDLENSYYDLICDFLETLNSNDIVYWRLDSIGGNTFVMFKLIKSHLNCKATSISIVSKAYSSIALLMLSIPLIFLEKDATSFFHGVVDSVSGKPIGEHFKNNKEEKIIKDICMNFMTEDEYEQIFYKSSGKYFNETEMRERLKGRIINEDFK